LTDSHKLHLKAFLYALFQQTFNCDICCLVYYILTLHNNSLTVANKTSPTEITPTYAKQILRVHKLHFAAA